MLLAIDIGNSNISIGVFDCCGSHVLRCHFSISSKSYSSDEYTLLIRDFLSRSGIASAVEGQAINDANISADNRIDCSVIASVVPKMTDVLARSASVLCGKPPFLISNGIHTGFGIRIRNPEQLGADIVCNTAAALHLTKVPFVILDMGTATTLTVVDRYSDVLGTIIIPGLRTSMNALLDSAAQLSDISLDRTDELIGRDTRSSICSGVLNGTILMIDGFLRDIRDELGIRDSGDKLGLIATGGQAQHVLPYTRNKFTFIEMLTLQGAADLYFKNVK